MNFSEVVYIFFGRHKIYQVETSNSFALVSTSNCSPVCAEKYPKNIDSLAVSHSTFQFARSHFYAVLLPFLPLIHIIDVQSRKEWKRKKLSATTEEKYFRLILPNRVSFARALC